MAKQFETIDEYINSCPEDVRPILETIRQAVGRIAPQAVEAISYQMPTFKLNGTSLVHFAAWKNHIALYPTPSGTVAFNKRISQYAGGKGTVRFPIRQPIPYDLIEDIIGFRMKEHLAKGIDRE